MKDQSFIGDSSSTSSVSRDVGQGDTVTAAVEAHGIRKLFGELVAVDDLTFSIEPREILGVLGPNGAGKTTAIRMLTTLLAPTRGTFAVAGVPHTRPTAIRQRIGVLPESAGYPERQTGEEFLRYHARLYGHGRAGALRTLTAACSQRSGSTSAAVADREHTAAGCASDSGSRGRSSTSRAVVFLDEPTLGLDPAGQRRCSRSCAGSRPSRGATVLLSTHLLAEVEEVCSRVLILNRGRVAADGTVAEVARRAAAPREARGSGSRADRRRSGSSGARRRRGVSTPRTAEVCPGTVAATSRPARRRPDAEGCAARRGGRPRARVRARGCPAERRLSRDDGGA